MSILTADTGAQVNSPTQTRASPRVSPRPGRSWEGPPPQSRGRRRQSTLLGSPDAATASTPVITPPLTVTRSTLVLLWNEHPSSSLACHLLKTALGGSLGHAVEVRLVAKNVVLEHTQRGRGDNSSGGTKSSASKTGAKVSYSVLDTLAVLQSMAKDTRSYAR